MTRMVYIVGAPGVGKSTVIDEIVDQLGLVRSEPELIGIKLLWGEPLSRRGTKVGVQLGKPHEGGHPGTDRLSMEVSPEAIGWIQSRSVVPLFVIGEGARLGTKKFLTAAAQNTKLFVVHLTAEDSVVDDRCEERGSAQKPQFRLSMKSSARSATEAAKAAGARTVEIDTTHMTVHEVAETVLLLL